MRIVVKVGGQAAEDPKQRRNLVRQIAQLRRTGHDVVMVHGGGKALTATLEKMGIATEFHQGLRVTNAATRDVALMVLAGIVNKQWVANLEATGQPALGICGGDGKLVIARKHYVGTNGSRRDLGYVGRPSKINPAVVEAALERGMVPVIASLALSPRGEYLNVNADDLAAALAAALGADRLLYLTESGGVWDADRKLLPVVRMGEIQNLIRKGIVKDGMIPKLRSCARTLKKGVHEIDIIASHGAQTLMRAIEGRDRTGTRILRAQ
jgi:acetylglutamate kinase